MKPRTKLMQLLSTAVTSLWKNKVIAGFSESAPNPNPAVKMALDHDAGDWALRVCRLIAEFCPKKSRFTVRLNTIDANASGGGGGGGSAQYLNDLLDVEIGGTSGPFDTAPAIALGSQQLLKYDGGSGLWKNADIVGGGTF